MSFTNELRVHVSTCERRVRVWTRPGERYAESNIIEYDRYGSWAVIVWDSTSLDGHTDLQVIDGVALTAVTCRDEVLQPNVRHVAGVSGPDFILMQGNARAHTPDPS